MTNTKLNAVAFLTDRRREVLGAMLAALDHAVASGIVPNKLFNDAKDIFNRCAEDAAEAFLRAGPSNDGHHMSNAWRAAYHHDAFVRGTHTLPAVLKRAQKAGMTDYAAFIGDLMPLRDLLETAKPLIRKRGELPVVKTAKQLADEADQMTCQCCGRGIFAATGLIAHHGYERPGHGWQTASCFGARRLPWEVSRDAVGDLITMLKNQLEAQRVSRNAVIAETDGVTHHYRVHVKTNAYHGKYEARSLRLDRKTFDAVRAEKPEAFADFLPTADFDTFKKIDVTERDAAIKQTKADIAEFTKRYEGWKQTHKRVGDKWEVL